MPCTWKKESSTRKKVKYLAWTACISLIITLATLITTILIITLLFEERFILKTFDNEFGFINETSEQKLEQARRLGGGIKIETISWAEDDFEKEAMLKLHNYLEKEFPLIHSSSYIEKHVINDFSLIFKVNGIKNNKPFLLCAHMDVVPIANEKNWEYNPFSGKVFNIDGQEYIYGRGALDDKHSLFGIMEAVENIIAKKLRPIQTFYIAFGHDEEVSGHQGASQIAKQLREELGEGRKFEFILDEGMMVIEGIFPGVKKPVIYIGVTEKTVMTVDIIVTGTSGHSSKPPKQSVNGILGKAVYDLENNPQPSKFGKGPEKDAFEYIATSSENFFYRIIFSNFWIFSSIFSLFLSSKPSTDSIQRTTTAVTMMHGGIKSNVIPSKSWAHINHRLHPASTIKEVLEHDIEAIGNSNVEVKINSSYIVQPVSPYGTDVLPFQIIARSAKDVFPNGVIVPGLMIGATDTRHYTNLSNFIYRFTPSHLYAQDLDRIHGANERISVENYSKVVNFYFRLIFNADAAFNEFENYL